MLAYATVFPKLTMPPRIILASSSKSRQQCLKRLNISFTSQAPDVDETPKPQEKALTLVKRLALVKAKTIANQSDHNSIIIAGDQVMTLGDHILGKPGSVDAAKHQLQLCSGQQVQSLSSLCVMCQAKNHHHLSVSICTIQYRSFNQTLIDDYINYDQPFHCAGSIQLETNGFILIESLTSDDPFSIYGLPILTLINQLTALGYNLPSLLTPPA